LTKVESAAFVHNTFGSTIGPPFSRQQTKPAHTDFDLCCHTATK